MERQGTAGRVARAGGVAKERFKTARRVVLAGCQAEERFKTDGRVVKAGNQTKERMFTLSGVLAGIPSVWWWVNCLRSGRKRKAGEHEGNEKERAQRRAVH